MAPRLAPDGGLAAALARAGDGVFAIGAAGRVVLWNRAAEVIMGYTAREVVGRACCEVFAGRDDRGNRLCYRGCHVMSLAAMGEPVRNFDMQTRTKSGRPVWLNMSILAISDDASRRIDLAVHLFRDVTTSRQLVDVARERLGASPADTDGDGATALTRREREILGLLAQGCNTRAVAERLHVSSATVRNHVQNILSKLGVHSRLEAVAYANRHRLF